MISVNERYETLVGEQLKAGAELSLSRLSASRVGRQVIETYAFGMDGRIMDDRLRTSISGISVENPIMVGAGWDKKGSAVIGLYCLGAAGTEVGTITEFGQPGNHRPRLWTVNADHSVGINRLGFNSPGAEVVDRNITKHAAIPGVLGINVGKNKELRDDHSAEYHAKVVKRFNDVADYFVFNPSSPNTSGLRENQKKGPMRDHMQAIMEVAKRPVYVKYAPDLPYKDLEESVEVVMEEGGAGLVIANTTNNEQLKAKYGERWGKELGGLSGDDPDYRAMTTAMLKHAYEEYGDRLELIGVGGVKDGATTLEKIRSGASLTQVVTAIRPSQGRVFADTNRELVEYMDNEGVKNIQDLIGVDTKRGVKQRAA